MSGSAPFRAEVETIAQAIGLTPTDESSSLGWTRVGVFRWRGPAEQYDVEALPAPWVILHEGGQREVRGRVGSRWAPGHSHPGLVTTLPPNQGSTWAVHGELDAVTFHLNETPLRELVPEPSRFREMLRRVDFRFARSDPWLQRLCGELVAELSNPREVGSLYADRLADVLGLRLLLPPREQHETTRTGGLAPHALRKVRERLEAAIADGVSLESLAETAGLSRFHFARAFRESTGESPHAYLTRLRLERARELLHQSSRSIAVIAAEAGFSSQAHLSSVFRKHFRETPGAFRRRA